MSKIFHFNDLEEFFAGDEWKMQIDVSDIWNRHSSNEIDLLQFNKLYYNRLIEYKDDVLQLGTDVWDTLNALLLKLNQKTDEKSLLPTYDEIYNWADQNDILIKTK